MNKFRRDLEYSILASDASFWDRIYIKAFPNMVGNMVCSGLNKSQLAGIDRVIHLSSGRTIYIDEKKRRAEYDDILLEFISVDTTGAPGWIEKDLSIDYLAYAFMQSQRVYLFDWLMLRRAWIRYKQDWKKQYKTIVAVNQGYKTYSLAVPTNILMQSIKTASIIQL